MNEKNIDEVGMFCVKSKPDSEGYIAKLDWIKQRFKEGLRYKVLLVDEGRKDLTSRGFIEYMPSEYAWRGINAENYMIIHCFWVVGRWKKHGFGAKLLEICLQDSISNNKSGVAVLTSNKPFLTNGAYFKKQNFSLIAEQAPYYEIYAKIFEKNSPLPKFYEKIPPDKKENGIQIFESAQCPYFPGTRKVYEKVAHGLQLPVISTQITNSDQAKGLFTPYGTFGVMHDGTHFSHYYIKEAKIKEMLE